MTRPKLGIIAGAGALPRRLAEACREEDRPFFIVAIEGAAEMEALDALPHAVVRLGAVGEALHHLKSAGVAEVVLAGGVKRPSFSGLMPDAVGARLLARLGFRAFSGDDALLSAIVGFLEEEGFRVVGAEEVMGGLLAPRGALTRHTPDARARADVALGLRVAHALGALDVGQAVVVESGYVLAVEAAEGTDALISRSAALMRERGRAVLVKAKKPQQEARADLPAIGPATVARLHECGFLGLAVEAGAALILDRAEAVSLADRHGIFIEGVAA